MSQQRFHRFTSLARPLDPAWPSNKAVMFLAPLAALAGLAWSLYAGHSLVSALGDALVFALAVFGSWALARELLPDDHAAAFVSMLLAFLVCLAVSPGLSVLFVTLGLVRMVNRSSGLAARPTDSLVLTVASVWLIYAAGNPWFGAVAAVAFVLDGLLKAPQRRQWVFALVCLAAMIVYTVDHDVALMRLSAPGSLVEWLTIMALVLFSLNMTLLNKIHSVGDVGRKRLDLARVKGGIAVAILATLNGMGSITEVLLLLATIGGLCLGLAFRRAFRSPARGLRTG